MRDPQFLMNRRIIINHDISEATINAGWKRKSGAVANEDNLKKSGQGWDVIINEGYELSDVEKIIPSAVPDSDLALADQLKSLIFGTSGVDLENWSAQNDKNASSLTTLLKQGANLMVLQKYFDQWDYSLKQLGDTLLKIVLNNWNAPKVSLIIGEEPTPHFYSHIFAKYQVVVEEGLNTATQKNMQAQQLLDINQIFGREVFPPSFVVKDMNLSGRAEAVQFLKQQEEMASAQQQHSQNVAQVFEEAKVKELYSKAAMNIANAKERMGRVDSNIGLFEERLSMINRNDAMSLKDKTDALAKLIEVTTKFGELEAHLKMNELKTLENEDTNKEEQAKVDVRRQSLANDFTTQIISQIGGGMQQ